MATWSLLAHLHYYGDNLGHRDVSFDNILLDDGELVDVQVGVIKLQDTVTNVTNNKCNTERNQTQDVTDVENTGINK